jgi:hypothetical protein
MTDLDIEEVMGEMADLDIEEEQDLWWDHQAGHPNFDILCPYCEEEYHQKDSKSMKWIDKKGVKRKEKK